MKKNVKKKFVSTSITLLFLLGLITLHQMPSAQAVLYGTEVQVTTDVNTQFDPAMHACIRIDNPEPQANALFGRAVSRIGDIDGDGLGDLVIGASGADSVYVLSGIDQSIIHIIEDPDGLSEYRFGYAVCGVGDLDSDGVEDIAVGAPGPVGVFPLPPDPLDPQPRPEWGRVFIFSGATGGLILSLLPDIVLWPFTFGASVASLGDVNGDGISDIVAGAPLYVRGWGSVWAYSGHDGSLIWGSVEPSPSPEDWGQECGSFGAYLSDIADLTGDGCRDLLVAAPFHDCDPDPDEVLIAGKAYVLDGSDGTIFRTHDCPAPSDGWTWDSIIYRNLYGACPGAIGDQDGDGVEDYAFGESGAAIVHLFSGASGNLIRDINSPSDVSTDFFGWQIAGDGDRDADGLNDFWVAAPGVGPPPEGIVYLINSVGHVIGQVNDPSLDSAGGELGFGWRLSSIEDLDGDGIPDLLIGKPRESVNGFERAGAVFLVLSDTEPPAIVVEVPLEGQAIHDDVTFTATVSDPSGVEWVKFSIREPNGDSGTPIDPMFESMSASHVGDDTWELLFDTTQLPDGYYLFLVNASDSIGNARARTTTVILDNTPPTTLLTASPQYVDAIDNVYIAPDTEHTLSVSDIGITATYYRYYQWGTPIPDYSPYTTPFQIMGTNGPYVIEYYSEDMADNTESVHFQVERLARGRVSWWPGDDNPSDITGGNHGTLWNNATFAIGKTGQAFNFDGVDDYMTAPGTNINELQQLTLDAWVKLYPSVRTQHLITIWGGVKTMKARLTYHGKNDVFSLTMGIQGASGFNHYTISVSNVTEVGVFHHVAATYDGEVMRLYVDGEEVGNLAVGGPIVPGRREEAVQFSFPTAPLYGLLDEVEIYNRALTASEIQAIHRRMLHVVPMRVESVRLPPHEEIDISASIPSHMEEAGFSSSWSGSDVVMTLVSPSGRTINRDTMDPDITHLLDANFEIYRITHPEAGDWTIQLYGADVPETGEEVAVRVMGTIEVLPPETTLSIGSPQYNDATGNIYVNSSTPFTLTAVDDGDSGVASTVYRIYDSTYDSGWVTYDASFNLAGLENGTYYIAYNSTDNVGNVEVTKTAVVILDDTGPQITVSNPPPEAALQDEVTFIASTVDDGSGTFSLTFSIREADGGDGVPVGFEDLPASYDAATREWRLSFDTLLLPDGYYVVLAKAEDNLGNTASTIVPYSIRNWAVVELLPASKTNKAGRTMPVKFSLRVAAIVDPLQPFVYNEELTIEIYAADGPDEILQESSFSDHARDYRINSDKEFYITNFRTLKKPELYVTDIYRKDMLIGSFTFETVK